MSASIVRANALRLPLPDQCVDLIVTSPPYFALRSYQDDDGHYDGQIGSEATPADFLVALWRVLDECWRVLKPSGSCWVNLGDKYAGSGGHNNGAYGVSGLHKDRPVSPTRDQGVAVKATLRSAPDRYNQAADVLPKSVMGLPWRFALGASCPDPYRTVYDEGEHPQWINRRPLIWLKANGLPESVTDRTRANFEDWFMLTKQGRYFSAVDEIREPHLPSSLLRTQRANVLAHEDQDEIDMTQACHPLGRLPGSVWTIATEPLIVPEAVQRHYGLPDHFAAFPQEWPRRIILGFSPSGVCMACGEGRRPVVDRTAGEADSESEVERLALAQRCRQAVGGGSATTLGRRDVQYEVTGHACACPTPDAPTRPPLVIDPFGGTGTVAGVANALGRHGLSFDLSGSYCRLARWRIRESGHFAKTASRTDRDRQGSLFGTPAG